jgi:hypothetical protein
MESDIIPMSQKERQRFHLLEMVIGGKITLKDAGKRMGVSYRWGRGVYTFDKMLGFLLIHHFTVIIPCLLICEMCRPDPFI